VLRAAGCEQRGHDLNSLAVELARRAAQSADTQGPSQNRCRPWVAASVAPVEDCYRPDLVPNEATVREEHRQMLAWLVAAQPDMVWIETMNTIREAVAAATAARETGLPFVVSFVTSEAGGLLGGESLGDAVSALAPLEPLAFGLNCIPPEGVTRLLPNLRRLTPLPIAVYAHINNAHPIPGWSFCTQTSPQQYAAQAQTWLDSGASIIGGCCGTTPAHIAACRAGIARCGG
jgi:S-methylmethionine-dependent homocysteine/selenocysteine methylase